MRMMCGAGSWDSSILAYQVTKARYGLLQPGRCRNYQIRYYLQFISSISTFDVITLGVFVVGEATPLPQYPNIFLFIYKETMLEKSRGK
jgi:hypothetical protein